MQVSQATARVAFNGQQTLVAVLLLLMVVLNYLDRQILSVLAPVMRKELGLSQSDYAFAVNAFLLSYAFMYTGSGLVLDRVGSRPRLPPSPPPSPLPSPSPPTPPPPPPPPAFA